MNYTRTFLRESFLAEEIIPLDKKDFHHEINVLRKKEGDKFIVFDGKGSSGLAQVFKLDKKSFEIKILEVLPTEHRSGIDINLGQALIKNNPFQFSVQKATELGVKDFSPLLTERISIKRQDYNHLIEKCYQTAQGACEQCGENWLPVINSPQKVENWASASKAATKIVLFPGADKKLTDIDIKESVALAIGPEGDFTEQEIETLTEFGFVPVTIGNRILRAETATIAAISALRYGKKEF
tara:strand:+ start:678 stop:1397 length:720 start_codon:yes stop_codon:yes gene_type:complete